MAELNLKYYNNVDGYSDGDVEIDIMEFVKEGIDVTEIPEDRRSYAAAYHLSVLRENIINWYPLKKTDRVLEIGAGCGAITGALCRNAGSVVSAELSKRRAEINYERHKDCDNLEIVVGNLNDMEFEEKFDYVILIGVFEYAMSFTTGEKPYETFLNNIKKFVKPGGKILMAIENRLGQKYFAGAYEDHTDAFFLGINEYAGNDAVRTFSKSELTQIFHDCGMDDIKFFYPYPDYKFPSEIYTDETINQYSYGREYMNLEQRRYSLYNEKAVTEALVREGVMEHFANSFFVEAQVGEGKKQEDKLLYAKMNNGRKAEFRIATIIFEGSKKYVIKKALHEKAVAHLERVALKSNINTLKGLKNLSGTYKDGSVYYEFLEEENLDSKLCQMMETGKTLEIIETIKGVKNILLQQAQELDYQTEEFKKIFGNVVTEDNKKVTICPANIDCICDNIICREEGYVMIDGEWIFDLPVPVDFIMWRMVNELYTQHENSLEKLIVRERMYDELSISTGDSIVYETWAKYFSEQHVGTNPLAEYGADIRKIDLRELIELDEKMKADIKGVLYYDRGNGFCIEDCCDQSLNIKDGNFQVTFEVEDYENIERLRFDPLEVKRCKMQILTINGVCLEGGELLENNAEYEKSDIQVFINGDPQYLINPKLLVDGKITIAGRIKVMTEQETMFQYQQSVMELKNTIACMEAQQRAFAGSSLYYDTGKGFCAEDCYKQELDIQDGEFKVSFELDKYATIKNLRFDPLEDKGCKIQITEINGVSPEDQDILGNNAEYEKNGVQIFVNGDPQYYINPTLPKEGKITIAGKIKVLTEHETMAFFRKKIDELESIKTSKEYRILKKMKLMK